MFAIPDWPEGSTSVEPTSSEDKTYVHGQKKKSSSKKKNRGIQEGISPVVKQKFQQESKSDLDNKHYQSSTEIPTSKAKHEKKKNTKKSTITSENGEKKDVRVIKADSKMVTSTLKGKGMKIEKQKKSKSSEHLSAEVLVAKIKKGKKKTIAQVYPLIIDKGNVDMELQRDPKEQVSQVTVKTSGLAKKKTKKSKVKNDGSLETTTLEANLVKKDSKSKKKNKKKKGTITAAIAGAGGADEIAENFENVTNVSKPKNKKKKKHVNQSANAVAGPASAIVEGPDNSNEHEVSKQEPQAKKRLADGDISDAIAKKPKKVESALTLSLREKLTSSRFRYVNELLYTSSSGDSLALFQEDPEAYAAYHQGFQGQVTKWPQNPLDVVIENIKKLPKGIVADFGCGDARLAQTLTDRQVHSFDLVASNSFVTACDMAHVPLKSASVDIAVFCLSLMGTNLKEFILEANRVLKKDGHFLMAEVTSRCNDIPGFLKALEKFGFKLLQKNDENSHFFFAKFMKLSKIVNKNKLPKIYLKPCMYKKR